MVDQPASPEIELADRLRGRAGDRRVGRAKIALADRLSYLELDERVNRPARFFRDSGHARKESDHHAGTYCRRDQRRARDRALSL